LKETCGAEDSIAAPLEDLDLVIEPLDKATALAVEEVIGDLVEAFVQGGEEAVKAGQPAVVDETGSGLKVVAGLSLGERSIEDEGEHLAQHVDRFQGRGVREQPIKLLPLLRC
jgi:hypothetical protein